MSQGLIDHLRELSDGMDGVSFKRMFGGWGMFQNGRMFGLVARDTAYLKTDALSDPVFDAEELDHFTVEKKSGQHLQTSYRRLPERCLDDVDEFQHWARYGIAAANRTLPKPPRKSRARSF